MLVALHWPMVVMVSSSLSYSGFDQPLIVVKDLMALALADGSGSGKFTYAQEQMRVVALHVARFASHIVV